MTSNHKTNSSDELKRRFPNASSTFLRLNSSDTPGIPPGNAQSDGRVSLVSKAKRNQKVHRSVAGRLTLRITVYAVRPADWDGWFTKPIQDGLRHAQLLVGDDWHLLRGEVTSEKVQTVGEERTVIEIIAPG